MSPFLLVATAFLASSHSAAGQSDLQLDMARVPQPVQRQEFPLVGEESAFKFNFITQVSGCSSAWVRSSLWVP
jgi:hypothetical protein